MEDLEMLLKAFRQSQRRKKELKNLIEILYDEYKLVKTEINVHQKHIEKLMSAKEYSAFLDTIKIDTSLELPVFSEKRSKHTK